MRNNSQSKNQNIMKRTSTIILAFLALNSATIAQELTAAVHQINVGDSYTWFEADTAGVMAGPSGSGQTWNFSSISLSTNQITLDYVDPSTTPSSADFPSANVAQYDGTDYTYYNSTSTMLESYGTSANSTIYTDPHLLFNFPFAFNDQISDVFEGAYDAAGTPSSRDGESTTTADGTGTLITPTNTFNNVLRTRMEVTMIDSVEAFGNTIVTTTDQDIYQWYDPNAKFPLMQIVYLTSTTESGGQVFNTTTNKLVYVNSDAVGLEEETNSPIISMYPNPANNILNIAAKGDVDVSIYSVLGEIVLSTSGNNSFSIDVSSLTEGSYVVMFSENDQNYAQKLIIR